jgi:tetratricopeptide (TPR) repeat protein
LWDESRLEMAIKRVSIILILKKYNNSSHKLFFRILISLISFCSPLISQNTPILLKDCPRQQNIDSLELFLTQNPSLSAVTRLKVLITLERNFLHNKKELIGSKLTEIHQLSQALNNTSGMANYYYIQSRLDLQHQEKLEAYKNMTAALSAYQTVHDTIGMAYCYRYLMRMYYGVEKSKRMYDEDRTYFLAAEDICNQTSNVEVELCLLDLKIKYFEHFGAKPNIEAIENCYNEAMRLIDSNAPFQYLRVQFWDNLANVYQNQNLHEKALSIYFKMLNDKNSQNPTSLTIRNLNIGSIYMAQKKYQLAHQYFDKSLKYAYTNPKKNSASLEEIYTKYTEILKWEGKYKQAIDYSDSANVYKNYNNSESQTLNVEKLKIKNNEFLKKQEISQLESKEKDLKTIILLSMFLVLVFLIFGIYTRYKINEIRKLKEFQDQLFTIIGHDLRSPLIGTQGLTQEAKLILEEKQYDFFPQIISAIEQSHQQMSLLLSNLLSWIKTYQKHENIPQKELNLKAFVLQISAIYKDNAKLMGTDIVIDIDENLVLSTAQDDLAVILRNALDNAIKRANNQKVCIKATLNDQKIDLNINNMDTLTDDALAFAKTILESDTLQHIETSKSFGLTLMKKFATRIGCTLEIESNVAAGTNLTLRFG